MNKEKGEKNVKVFRELMQRLKYAKPRKMGTAIGEIAYRTAVWDIAELIVNEADEEAESDG